MEIPIKEPIVISDGKHVGKITEVRYRTVPYHYTDLVITFTEELEERTLKVGYPTMLRQGSKLGKLMKRFGFELVVGEGLDPDSLKEFKCQFQTITEETERGTFAKVIQDSVKPLEEWDGKQAFI